MADLHARDRALAERMLRGEEAAFEEFFQAHFARLFRFAMARMNHDADAAEDVVQTSLCNAVSGLKGYRGEAALFTWLCTICRREILAFFERRGRAGQATELAEDSPEVRAALESLLSTSGGGPDETLRRKEIARRVQVTLDSLPASYGDALEWKYIQGLSVKEIAERLDLGPKAAESLLTRAREAFRDGFAAVLGTR